MSTKFDSTYPANEFSQLISKPAIHIEDFNVKPKGERALLEDLQAGIIKHHRRRFGVYVFIKFFTNTMDRRREALEWISSISPNSALDESSKTKNRKSTLLNFFLSSNGYSDLNIKDFAPDSCSAFQKDLTPEIRDSFNNGTGKVFQNGEEDGGEFHAVLLIADNNTEKLEYISLDKKSTYKNKSTQKDNDLKEKINELKQLVDGKPQIQFAFLNANKREWFGYKDGMNIPRFFPSGSKFDARESDVPSLTTILVQDKGGKHKFSAGSYMVFLKFQQHAKNFEALKKKISKKLKESDFRKGAKAESELAGAYIMGQFKDGTPVTLNNQESSKKDGTHHFDYSEIKVSADDGDIKQSDAQASRCPFHAHTRKANPRDENDTYYNNPVHRRGMLYNDEDGNFKAKSEKETDTNKNEKIGVLFISFQSNIQKQFENNIKRKLHIDQYLPNGLKSGKDLLTAKVNNEMYSAPKTWNHSDPNNNQITFEYDLELTSLIGGGYFFAPSISFFERISDLVNPPVSDPADDSVEIVKTLKLPKFNRDYLDENTGLVRIRRKTETGVRIKGRENKPFLNRKPPPLKKNTKV